MNQFLCANGLFFSCMFTNKLCVYQQLWATKTIQIRMYGRWGTRFSDHIILHFIMMVKFFSRIIKKHDAVRELTDTIEKYRI